ncbi:MAG: trifunctional serine/threonine-protein kinase/ATP-binding protein/sensor histidine kinase [Oscillatoriaceae cyanobacterium Prado104]|jgi:predicted ATPase/signal transduction histidine kinase|nr:trifunctional serine/threonine-protein kinase/ATP-binding protein/sensor histidine kinase [Oscillatoriaceae cyanobacterium Prado104]
MQAFSEYQIQAILHEDIETAIYRAKNPNQSNTIIIKLLKPEYPTLEAIARFKHEYLVRQNLNHENTVKALSLESFDRRLALVLEDFGGISLEQLLQTEKLNTLVCLRVAIKIVKGLKYLHENQIIHKDIKPSNIIINTSTEQVKISDFGIASKLSKETPIFNSYNSVEGSIAYISPEQTGRMNRYLDYRSDFYSLGITLYQMLTGKLPFASRDPLEIVYSHLAVAPVPPEELNPEIPAAISAIAIKLIAKNAEDRYQSAAGILADLESCLHQLETAGEIVDFVAGQLDASSKLLIPQKLYGREQQVKELLAAFQRISSIDPPKSPLSKGGLPEAKPSRSKVEVMLVSGYSGIGKSAVINEISKSITHSRGYFISGKFDQFKRNIPYASFSQAISSLIRQLLAESDEKLPIWRSKILASLGDRGQVIIDVIPELELIVGKQPEVPQLGPVAAQNRFDRTFKDFIRVFASDEHPLVIFLDDLQWTDSATLKLMETLVTDAETECLLFLGAYRDNEVSATHPLIQTLEEIQKKGTTVNNIDLQPLDLADAIQLLSDTLGDRTDRVNPLAELIWKTTAGNPFFLRQLIHSLEAENLLKFDFNINRGKPRGWQWNIAEIEAVGIANQNVVELVCQKVQKLPTATREVLKLAACIGDKFTLDILSIVNEKPPGATANELYLALQAGLILPLSNAYKIPLAFDEAEVDPGEIVKAESGIFRQDFDGLNKFPISTIGYRFLHDRVQQAAYSLIPEWQKQSTHLKIGQLLLQNIPESEIEEHIFEIVNQLNIGDESIALAEERIKLARLNLIAGRKAKAATAWLSAVKYLRFGLKLLPENSWECHYELTLALYVEAIEAEYLNTNYQQSKQLIDIAIARANTVLDRVQISESKIQYYTSQGDFLGAIDTGMKILAWLGNPLPQSSEGIRQISEQLRSELVIETSKIAELKDLPLMKDAVILATARVLVTLIPPVYFANPELLFPVILLLVKLSVKYGNSTSSAYGYCLYGLLLCGAFNDIEAGYLFGKLSLKVLKKFPFHPIKCQVYKVFASHIQPWKKPLRDTAKKFLTAIQTGIETGNAEYTGYGSAEYVMYLFFSGENLENVDRQSAPYEELLQNLKQEFGIFYLKLGRQAALNFAGKVDNPCILSGESFNEATMFPAMVQANYRMIIFCFHLFKLMLFCFFKDCESALVQAELAAPLLDAVVGTIFVAEYNFYHSLALLARCDSLSEIDRQQAIRTVESNQEKMRIWAASAAVNFQHKYDLVAAETARILGQTLEAIEYYDRAIKGAKTQGYSQESALASELAGEFYLQCGRQKVARLYLSDAYYDYLKWGGLAKVKNLESKHFCLLREIKQKQQQKSWEVDAECMANCSIAAVNFNAALDLTTFIKFSQAIASEIVLEKLLAKLIKILLQNSGAQKAALLLLKNNELYIEAIGSATDNEIIVFQSIPPATEIVPILLINTALASGENMVLDDASSTAPYNTYPYIKKYQPKSILCLQVVYQSQIQGIIYLENNLTSGAFTKERIDILKVLVSQAAISIVNAKLYSKLESAKQQLEDYSQTLEQKVEERTAELKAAQNQIIANEKLSSLGTLTAGVAHELRNPLNFVNNYAESSVELSEELLEEIDKQADNLDADTLDYFKQMVADIRDNDAAIHQHGKRAENIIRSMMQHARTDSGLRQLTDINALLKQAIQLAYQSKRVSDSSFYVAICTDCDGAIEQLEVAFSDLSRAFINTIENACYAVCAKQKQCAKNSPEIGKFFRPKIWVKTRNFLEYIEIRIRDNGIGIPLEIREKIFHPFFTTKPAGEGTGLGLSLTRDIIVGQHGGTLAVESETNVFTEFVITLPKVR